MERRDADGIAAAGASHDLSGDLVAGPQLPMASGVGAREFNVHRRQLFLLQSRPWNGDSKHRYYAE
jgi:hypothetical protein